MIQNKNIAIVDYGVSNLWSVLKATRIFASNVFITEEKDAVASADAILLPGIGTFKAGMEGLRVRGLVKVVQEAARRGVPILGICLGAQLLLEKGFEFGEHEGLGIIKGQVVHFPELRQKTKVPAIGWQEVTPATSTEANTLFIGIDKPFFYFVHTYVMQPEESVVLAKTSYGGYDYCAAMGTGRVYGTQFHPEKSADAGLHLLKNFINSI